MSICCLRQEVVTVLTPELQHHGKSVCANCGKFFGWVKKPETVAREGQNAQRIVAAGKLNLTPWEKAFIGSLSEGGPKLSPKQQASLDKLAAKYSL